jgi:hypothetical protein
MDFDNFCQEKEGAEINGIGNSADKDVPKELDGCFIALGEKKGAYADADGVYHPIAP